MESTKVAEGRTQQDLGAQCMSADQVSKDQDNNLQEMMERVRVNANDSSVDSDMELTDSEKEEQHLKTLFYSKLDDTIGTSTKAKVALQQMMRIQVGDAREHEPRESRLQRYKALLQSLTEENHVLKQQLAQLRDKEQSTSFSSATEK